MTSPPTSAGPVARSPRSHALAWSIALGAAVSLAIGLSGSVVHSYTLSNYVPLGFSSVATFKSWTATVVLVLALVQLVTALWMYGHLPLVGAAPRRLGIVHRTSGFTAFALSIPVAFYCLYDYGFHLAGSSPRIIAHSVLGCLFYGVFVVKVTVVRSKGVRGWVLPVVGGTVVALIVLVWSTSALWFFQVTGLHG